MINKTKTKAAVVLALLVASTSAGLAHARHARHIRPFASAPTFSSAPARIIEVRPGLWVGSYQCITDLDRGGRDCSSGM
jgi:hypothetical protein